MFLYTQSEFPIFAMCTAIVAKVAMPEVFAHDSQVHVVHCYQEVAAKSGTLRPFFACPSLVGSHGRLELIRYKVS